MSAGQFRESKTGDRCAWVSQPHATFGIVTKDGRVIDAPPIARWSIGRDERSVAAYFRQHGAEFRSLPQEEVGEMTGKLVRDRIPEIIRARGDRPVTRVADSAEFHVRLGDKLVEEAQKARDADRGHQAEELADTLEVVYAMADQIGLTREGLEKIREDKATERGGFRDRIIWMGNEEIGE